MNEEICEECEGSGVVIFDWCGDDETEEECDVCGGRGYLIIQVKRGVGLAKIPTDR